MIKIHNLKKSFGKHLALHVDELEIAKGDMLLVRGANGAGKSTFLKLLGGLLVSEKNMIVEAGEIQRGYYAPSFLLYDELTVAEHFRLLSFKGKNTTQGDVGENFGLNDHSNAKVKTLSRGWRARLGLSLAFTAGGDLLLLDEPLAELDEDGRKLFFQSLENFHQNGERASCIATHRPELYEQYNPKCITFTAGAIQ